MIRYAIFSSSLKEVAGRAEVVYQRGWQFKVSSDGENTADRQQTALVIAFDFFICVESAVRYVDWI